MNQRGLYDDDPTLRLLKPVFQLVEVLLKSPLAPLLFNNFRSKASVETILREQVYIRKERVTPELVDLLYEPSCDEGALGCFISVFTGDPGPRPDARTSRSDGRPRIMRSRPSAPSGARAHLPDSGGVGSKRSVDARGWHGGALFCPTRGGAARAGELRHARPVWPRPLRRRDGSVSGQCTDLPAPDLEGSTVLTYKYLKYS